MQLPTKLREHINDEMAVADAGAPTDQDKLYNSVASALDDKDSTLGKSITEKNEIQLRKDLGEGEKNKAEAKEFAEAKERELEHEQEMEYQARREGKKKAVSKFDADDYDEAVKTAQLEAEYKAQMTAIDQERSQPRSQDAKGDREDPLSARRPWEDPE